MARIVMINDEHDLLEICRMILASSGHRVLTLISGVDANSVVERFGADLVLLDWVMPDATGDEVLARLRASPRTAHVPIVVISALPEVQARARSLGADAVLPKPFLPDELRAIVDHTLASITPSREAP